MPVTVERLPDQPIIVATLSGTVTVDDIKEMYRHSSEIMQDSQEVFYRITDTREATSTFPEMLKAIQSAAQEMPGSTTDPRVRATFIGTNIWIDFARNAFQHRGIPIAAFTDMETALESIRLQLSGDTKVE